MATTHTSVERPSSTTHTSVERPSATTHTSEKRGVGGADSTWNENTETWDETASLADPDSTWDVVAVIGTAHTAEARP